MRRAPLWRWRATPHMVERLKGWPLEAETGHAFQLLRKIEQLPLVAGPSNELHADGHSVVQAGRDRHGGRVREADRKHELDVAPVRLAQECRDGVDRHR